MTTQIPPERVPPIAKEVSSTRKMWAALWWFGTLLFGVAAFSAPDSDHDVDLAGKILGGLFLLGLPFWLGLRQLRLARRADRAVHRASDASATFVLSGRELLAYDNNGVPEPDASVKLSRRHATMLTALPKAELRS